MYRLQVWTNGKKLEDSTFHDSFVFEVIAMYSDNDTADSFHGIDSHKTVRHGDTTIRLSIVDRGYLLLLGEIGGVPDTTRYFATKRELVNYVQRDTDVNDRTAARLYRTGHIWLDESNSGLDTGGNPRSWYARIERL